MAGEGIVGTFKGIAATEVYPGVTRRTFDTDSLTCNAYSFEPGATFPIHRHVQEQVTLVLDGEVEMSLGVQSRRLTAGAWAVTEPQVAHGIVAGPKGAEVVAIISPRRNAADGYGILASG
jgi:quercetin dioxygenase-like cupin family protein